MTDTTTLDETPDSEELPELVESESLGSDAPADESPLKTRVLLPLLVPLISILIVAVQAESTLTFNAKTYTAKAGVVQFNYSGPTGHTLAIQDPKFEGFLLTTDAGGPKTGKVQLTPGSYTIYCTVPGHEAAGMKATV